MKAYLTTMKCYGLLFACLFFPSIALANQEQPPWVAEAQNLGLEVWNARPTAFKICPEPDTNPVQGYALCAAAQCSLSTMSLIAGAFRKRVAVFLYPLISLTTLRRHRGLKLEMSVI